MNRMRKDMQDLAAQLVVEIAVLESMELKPHEEDEEKRNKEYEEYELQALKISNIINKLYEFVKPYVIVPDDVSDEDIAKMKELIMKPGTFNRLPKLPRRCDDYALTGGIPTGEVKIVSGTPVDEVKFGPNLNTSISVSSDTPEPEMHCENGVCQITFK